MNRRRGFHRERRMAMAMATCFLDSNVKRTTRDSTPQHTKPCIKKSFFRVSKAVANRLCIEKQWVGQSSAWVWNSVLLCFTFGQSFASGMNSLSFPFLEQRRKNGRQLKNRPSRSHRSREQSTQHQKRKKNYFVESWKRGKKICSFGIFIFPYSPFFT